MATASSVCVEASEKECSVCNEPFTEPKLLPCGHLLCQHCVLSWLHKQKDASCPLCRCPIVDTEKWGSGEIDFEAFADSLPTDLAMKALVDAERILNKQHKCQGCKNVAATTICLHCGDFFCPTCTNIHKNMSVSKHHVVEELSSLTPEKLSAKRWEEPCAVHADKTSEVFCPKHGASVCLLCATTDHRQCPEVTSLETKMAEAQKILKELAATLSQGEARLERGLSDLEQHMHTVEKKTQAAIAEIEDTCNRLESAVKACRRRLKELTQGACGDVRESVNGGKGVLLCRKGKLTTHKRAVERAQGMTSRSDVTSMTQALQARVKELDHTVTLPTEVKDINDVTLTLDMKSVASIEEALSKLGGVTTSACTKLGGMELKQAAVSQKAVPEFRFHHNHGSNIVLSNNQTTAIKTKDGTISSVTVIGSCPMQVNVLYEIRIDKVSSAETNMMIVGVVTSSPDHLVLPTDWVYGKAFAIVLGISSVMVNGTQVPSDLGQTLENMPVGSRVGLSLNDKRDLLLYRDGQLKGTITTAVPDPVYVVFDVYYQYKQITALPPTLLQ